MSSPPPSQNSCHQSHYSTINQTPSTTNGMMDHDVVSSWKKAQVRDAHSHLYLPHLLLHGYSNPLTAFYANTQPLASPPATQAMTARVAFLTCSALLMILQCPAVTMQVERATTYTVDLHVNVERSQDTLGKLNISRVSFRLLLQYIYKVLYI